MHNQTPDKLVDYGDPMILLGPAKNPVDLHPFDQERLELQGELPDLPLLVNPAILANLRKAPSSVHTIETSDRNSPSTVERTDAGNSQFSHVVDDKRQDYTYRGYLLRPRMDAYIRALEIYSAADGSFGGKFSSRLQSCRKNAWFVKNVHTNHLRVASSRCKLRWCPICRDVSRMIVTAAVDEWLKEQQYPKMLTLTLQHSDDPLILQIKKLYKCFRKLRTRAYFKRNVPGGVWFFQLKINSKTGQWHPHIHCLISGQFLSHSKLKGLWHKITDDSFIVDIRPVKDLDAASTEVARYATSPADLTKMSLESALDVYFATKDQRICGTWGTARGMVLRPTVQDDSDDWIKVADFYFVNVQKEFSDVAQNFWKCYKQDRAYTGPLVQDERDVFVEELAFIRETDPDPPNAWKHFMRVQERRSTFCLAAPGALDD